MIFKISPTHLPVLLLQLGSGRKSGTGEPLSHPLSTTIVHRVVYIALHHHHHLHGALYSVAPPPFHCTSPPPPCIVQCTTTSTIAQHNITPSLPPSCSPPCIMQCTLHCASTTTLHCTLHTAPCTTISCILLYWTALHCTALHNEIDNVYYTLHNVHCTEWHVLCNAHYATALVQ